MKGLFLVLAAMALPQASPAAEIMETAFADSERDKILDDMAVIISSAIARKDTDNPVFHGCVDWHSAAHGHWALLRIARVTGRHAAEAQAADLSLSPAGVEKEFEMLRKNPYFEMPYGRAWFLRLAVEHALWSRKTGGKDPDRLKAMADFAAESMLGYYGKYRPTPDTHEYANASWALAQLHAYCEHSADRRCLAEADRLIRENFLGDGGSSFSSDASAPEFFSPFGNWAYLIATAADVKTLRGFLARRAISEETLNPIETLVPNPHEKSEAFRAYPHHFGMNWSRAWALRALSRTAATPEERGRFDRAYRAHVAAAMAHHRKYAGDFWAYDHWIPQFAVYALTEGSQD